MCFFSRGFVSLVGPVGLGSFSSPSERLGWMSILGHVGAPIHGLCLITQCLVSAGRADGHNSSPLSLSNRPLHTDTTGQRRGFTRVKPMANITDAAADTAATVTSRALW